MQDMSLTPPARTTCISVFADTSIRYVVQKHYSQLISLRIARHKKMLHSRDVLINELIKGDRSLQLGMPHEAVPIVLLCGCAGNLTYQI